MKFHLSFTKIILIGTCFLLFTCISSCYKKKDTIAIITVLNNSESPIIGAEVRLFYEDTSSNLSRINILNPTTEDGTAIFNFNDFYKEGQGGFAVLDIIVNGYFKGVVQIEEMTTTKKTVYL